MNASARFLFAMFSGVVALFGLNIALALFGPQVVGWIDLGARFIGAWLGASNRL